MELKTRVIELMEEENYLPFSTIELDASAIVENLKRCQIEPYSDDAIRDEIYSFYNN
jgi:hypothetical protein